VEIIGRGRLYVLLAALLLLWVSEARAHAVVSPDKVAPNTFAKFVLRVPTEKEIPTIAVRLLVPENLQLFSIAEKPGWIRQEDKDSAGRYKSLFWSGAEVRAGEFVEFEFLARSPKEPGALVWKVFQTYKDGSVVSWVGPPSANEPASVTRVEMPAPLGAPAWATWLGLGISCLAALLALAGLFKHA
jgi:uncharacterized protein YcnI